MPSQGYPASGSRSGGHPVSSGFPGSGSRYGSHPAASVVSTGEILQLSTVAADGYGDMLTNVSALKECNPISDTVNGIQYVAFHTQAAKLKLAKRTLPNGPWTVDQSDVAATTPSDGHNFYSGFVDGSGRLHLSGDMHTRSMLYWRGTGPGDIRMTGWFPTPIASGSTLETNATYPDFKRLPNGDGLFFFRNGGSGDGDLVLYRWRDASNGGSDTWQILFTNLISGETLRSAYPHRIVFDPTSGKLGIAWCWRETTGIASNHDWCFMYSLYSEGFANWYKADGSPQTIPATQANAGYAATIAQNKGLDNSQAFTWDENGRPIIAGYYDAASVTGGGGQGISQFQLRFWDGSAWQARTVPPDARRQEQAAYSLVDATVTDVVPLSVPTLLRRGGRTYLPFRSTSRGEGVWAWVCEEPTLSNWTLVRVSTEVLGDWYPSIDESWFRSTGELMMYLQRTTRNPLSPIGATDVKVLRWKPADSYPYVAPASYFDPESVAGCLFAGSIRPNTVNVTGTPGANVGKFIDLLDMRAGSSRKFTQATNSNRPQYIYPGGIGSGACARFTKASVHSLTLTDATVNASLNGTNQPFTAFMSYRATTVTTNDMVWAFGSTTSTAQYVHLALGTGGSGSSLSVVRRTGGTQLPRETSPGIVTAGTPLLLTTSFDGANVRLWANGPEATWTTGNAFATAGALAIDNITLLCRQRTTRDNPGDGDFADFWLYSGALSQADRESIENALAAERGITLSR